MVSSQSPPALCTWLNERVPAVNTSTRTTYASAFYDHNAATIERVAKKNKEWLVSTSGVDEEDADDILAALASKSSSSGIGDGDATAAAAAAAAADAPPPPPQVNAATVAAASRPQLVLFATPNKDVPVGSSVSPFRNQSTAAQ